MQQSETTNYRKPTKKFTLIKKILKLAQHALRRWRARVELFSIIFFCLLFSLFSCYLIVAFIECLSLSLKRNEKIWYSSEQRADWISNFQLIFDGFCLWPNLILAIEFGLIVYQRFIKAKNSIDHNSMGRFRASRPLMVNWCELIEAVHVNVQQKVECAFYLLQSKIHFIAIEMIKALKM